MVLKYKLHTLPDSTNISNARALRYNNGPCCKLYSLQWLMQFHACSQFQKEIQILWEPTSFACLSNCWSYKFYKCEFPSIFVYQKFEMVYTNMSKKKSVFL